MKYKNKFISIDGIVFDSKREAKRYQELRLLEKAGEIQDLRLQEKFVLIPAQYEYQPRYSEKTGNRLKDKKVLLERECSYRADFVYLKNGRLVVEDTKGFRTKEYVIKRKLMLHVHGIRIQEI